MILSHLSFFSGGDADVSQDIVVLRAFVGRDMRHAAGADNQDVLFHFFLILLLG